MYALKFDHWVVKRDALHKAGQQEAADKAQKWVLKYYGKVIFVLSGNTNTQVEDYQDLRPRFIEMTPGKQSVDLSPRWDILSSGMQETEMKGARKLDLVHL